MYGRYSRQLEEFTELEDLEDIGQEKRRLKEDKARKKELRGRQGRLEKCVRFLWRHTFARLGEDWVFLALLGIIMALISFLMDRGIAICYSARIWLYKDLTDNLVVQYIAWVSLPVCLILFSAGFAHLVAPQSIGSGIPEMKTILRGVALKEYLTFRTLVAKVVGLTATLGSGLPLGKEGPFVHIASMTATVLSKLVTGFHGIYENESRATEMLAAACAVGVASCFAAPVGGVLFSIEVTTVYFAVRNYWRGFFAAVCGAMTFRLLAVWFQNANTVTAVFKTSFHMDFPFDPQELLVFALLGAICGVGGAFFVWVHRQYVIFMSNSKALNFLQKTNHFLYPAIVTLVVSTFTFPPGFGQFVAGEMSGGGQVVSLFTNFTWTNENATTEEEEMINQWRTPWTNVVTNLALYTIFIFIASMVCTTVPVPSGIFIPVFKIGAGFGRMVGELMHFWFPTGMRYGGNVAQIIPGGYAAAGAAAFSGSVTHTVSVSVIVFEMTGQMTHIIPIMISVLISNAIASFLMPSIYDSIILIKKLPYLPDLLPRGSGMYNIYVEDFMIRDVKYIYHGMSYKQLRAVLKENSHLKSFPLVDKPGNMILLGSVQKLQLVKLIEKLIGRERRLQVAAIRRKEAEETFKRLSAAEEMRKKQSVFHVASAPNILQKQMSEIQLGRKHTDNLVSGPQTKKPIQKRTNSFTLKGASTYTSTSSTSNPYETMTGGANRMRLAFETLFGKSAHLRDRESNTSQYLGDVSGSSNGTIASIPISEASSKNVQLLEEPICDMSPQDQKRWEEEQMSLPVDFCACRIDRAPFQLVEQTSLLKAHFLFSMVGVNYAYVTATGKLVGVVGLKELRKVIEDANSGALTEDGSENEPEGTVEDIRDSGIEQEPGAGTAATTEDSAV